MLTINPRTIELTGTNYEIGYRLGKLTAALQPLRALHTGGFEGFGLAETADAAALFDRWCPGLTEELTGFADALEVRPEQVFFYGMTYLLPRCSHIALLPGVTANGKPLLARNYEFNHEAEDFALVKTGVDGKYIHMGTSVLHFGRDDGFNEHGLAVTMSSCGFPVGPMPYMRAPKLKGLQFWAVIRALLEQCKNVPEALACLEDMPIAYNLNLLILDKAGAAALVETLDGHRAIRRIGPDSPEQLLWATNHPLLPELTTYEPRAFTHSLRRYDYIKEMLAGKTGVTERQLRDMLLAPYPDGLCCYYFEEFFGTTKSMVISPAGGCMALCWGGRVENGWRRYSIAEPLPESAEEIQIRLEQADPAIYQYQPLL